MNNHSRCFFVSLTLVALTLAFHALPAQAASPTTQPRAARSVHLWYPAPPATLFYNEVTVDESHPGTYFCSSGFNHGYFGIQELAGPDDKVVIFSVWDPGNQNDPRSVEADRRAEVLFQGDDVTVRRFGGEGTGAQSFFRYPWKIGETCKFLIKATTSDKKTAYAAYFYRNDAKQWKHLATFQTQTAGDPLKGLYSFVEDFRRDGKTPLQRRTARYGNGWAKTVDGHWVSLTRATFSADRTPLLNIDAGLKDNAFYLSTGGQTTNTTKLGATISRPPAGLLLPDLDP